MLATWKWSYRCNFRVKTCDIQILISRVARDALYIKIVHESAPRIVPFYSAIFSFSRSGAAAYDFNSRTYSPRDWYRLYFVRMGGELFFFISLSCDAFTILSNFLDATFPNLALLLRFFRNIKEFVFVMFVLLWILKFKVEIYDNSPLSTFLFPHQYRTYRKSL